MKLVTAAAITCIAALGCSGATSQEKFEAHMSRLQAYLRGEGAYSYELTLAEYRTDKAVGTGKACRDGKNWIDATTEGSRTYALAYKDGYFYFGCREEGSGRWKCSQAVAGETALTKSRERAPEHPLIEQWFEYQASRAEGVVPTGTARRKIGGRRADCFSFSGENEELCFDRKTSLLVDKRTTNISSKPCNMNMSAKTRIE